MLQLECEIKIGELFFDFTHYVKIKSSWKTLTDTAVLKFPRNLKTKDDVNFKEVLTAGTPVSIKLGYKEYGITERFTGYVSDLGADTAIAEITCEDEMWNLKQTNINKSWKDGNVEDIIKYLKAQAGATWGYEILGDKVQIGQVKFENVPVSKCLQKLKDDYGMICFFRNGKLMVGKPYDPDSTKRRKVLFEYGRNVISWKDLKFKRKEEVKLKVKIVNHKANGTKKEFIAGDKDGEERTLDFYNRKEDDLKKEAYALLEKMKYDGYRGKIIAFGEPVIQHGDTAQIRDWRYTERESEIFVDDVETTFNVSKIRQEIELGLKV